MKYILTGLIMLSSFTMFAEDCSTYKEKTIQYSDAIKEIGDECADVINARTKRINTMKNLSKDYPDFTESAKLNQEALDDFKRVCEGLDMLFKICRTNIGDEKLTCKERIEWATDLCPGDTAARSYFYYQNKTIGNTWVDKIAPLLNEDFHEKNKGEFIKTLKAANTEMRKSLDQYFKEKKKALEGVGESPAKQDKKKKKK